MLLEPSFEVAASVLFLVEAFGVDAAELLSAESFGAAVLGLDAIEDGCLFSLGELVELTAPQAVSSKDSMTSIRNIFLFIVLPPMTIFINIICVSLKMCKA
ncbi:hypothetical protein [Clostridium guangxiense]|uniref:hypothetical protein n=1 Tax=Clostridium guangxiense TaxID=1662055 RepID=UPI001E5A40FF|nr:hypothetical protein [Clostridium guangxiense]MCD2348719.1 hypothetical protein [Clostridium guangxiense]